MAAPIKGTWARTYSKPRPYPYATALVWGTGINPVHQYYGAGPPLRLRPTSLREGDQPERIPPSQGVPDQLLSDALWGYTHEDDSYTGMMFDDRPAFPYGEELETPHERASTDNHPPAFGTPGIVLERFRSVRGGARRLFRSHDPQVDANQVQYVIPTETVSEGWVNKARGGLADSEPSDPSQYEIQTSMRQRYESRGNQASVARNTDEPRTEIDSRVAGQKLKFYSRGERDYDMFPRQQDEIPRPFYFRTAGTGPVQYMRDNDMYVIEPIQRVPPPDPSMGPPETEMPQQDFGYTEEDYFYA